MQSQLIESGTSTGGSRCPPDDVQANAAALVSAQNPQADRIVPSCDDAADYLRTLTISNLIRMPFASRPRKRRFVFKTGPIRHALVRREWLLPV